MSEDQGFACIERLSYDHSNLWDIGSGGSKGDAPSAHPPTDQNFLNFLQFFGKSDKFVCWLPSPGGLATPPMGNPGSAPHWMPFTNGNEANHHRS